MRVNSDFRNYYELIKKIGHGTMACIYMAILKNNKEKRAIKVFDKNNMKRMYFDINFKEPNDEDLKDYMDSMNEIKMMKIAEGKNKENINTVKFYEYFDTKDEFAIVMELCDDNLCRFLINQKQNNLELLKEILIQLNNTFKIMAQNRLVHRDIKLENILIKYEDHEKSKFIVKLCDYGASKLFLIEDILRTKIGTLYIMAPEIIEGKEYNEKCDLWSLGVVIYTLYFKENPYKGMNEYGMIKQIKLLGSNRLKKSGNNELDDLIRRLLTYDPYKRISWEEYFKHPFFNNNSNIINKITEKSDKENVK